MPYNPSSDFVALWRSVSGGVEKAEMPGMDFVIAALTRAGLMRVVSSATAPSTGQPGTAWFRPASPSFASEGALFLWDGFAYVPATPELFHGEGGSSGGDGGGDGGGGGPVSTTTNVLAIAQSTAVTIPTSGWHILPFTDEPQTDTMHAFDVISFKFKPTIAGVYSFGIRAYATETVPGTVGIALLKNDVGSFTSGLDNFLAISSIETAAAANSWLTADAITPMNGTTDYVRMFCMNQGSGIINGVGNNPIFVGWLLP